MGSPLKVFEAPSISLRYISLLALILLLIAPHTPAQGVKAEVNPSRISAKPGDRVNITLYITNLGAEEIEVRGLRLKVRSTRVYLLPLSIPFGEYYIPFDEPVHVGPGERKAIRKVIEVPYIHYAGDFVVTILVQTSAGEAVTHLYASLGFTPVSATIMIASLGALVGIVYGIYRYMKSRLSYEASIRRRVERIDKILERRDRNKELLEILEERKSRGKVSKEEYEDLSRRYKSEIDKAQTELDRILSDVEKDIERLSTEIRNLREEYRVLKERLAKGLADREVKGRLKHMENLIKEKERALGDLRVRLKRMRSGA